MNDTTFQGSGKVAYVPVVVNAKQSKPQTNADRIRAMSDEELAEFFKSPLFFNKPWCCLHETPCRHLDRKEFLCAECLLEWLKQEVTE